MPGSIQHYGAEVIAGSPLWYRTIRTMTLDRIKARLAKKSNS